MKNPYVFYAATTLAVGLPATALAFTVWKRVRLQRIWLQLCDRYRAPTGEWRVGEAVNFVLTQRNVNDWWGFRVPYVFEGHLTQEDKDYLISRIRGESAQFTLDTVRIEHELVQAIDAGEEPLEDGFEVQEGPQGEEQPVRRVRRGGHRHAARTVFCRVVAEIGLRPFSTAQALIVQDHARRIMKSMNVRHSDYARLLSLVEQLYFVPDEERMRTGALYGSEEFRRVRQLVDAVR